jgi:hypothetical protein
MPVQDGFEYVMESGELMPVFTAVRQMRCAQGISPPC